jgi:hypothetical protein
VLGCALNFSYVAALPRPFTTTDGRFGRSQNVADEANLAGGLKGRACAWVAVAIRPPFRDNSSGRLKS